MDEYLDTDSVEPLQKMGIDITSQKGGLKEGQTCIPDCRRPSEERQDQPRHHRLDEEYQNGAGKYGQGKQ